MEQPAGFQQDPRGLVCRLNLGLYGTKTANRGWNKELNSALTEFGYTRSSADHGLYFLQRDGKPVFLLTHVDDLIHAGEKVVWHELVVFLKAKYEFTDLGELSWVLGMRVSRDRGKRTITLDQQKFIETLGERFGLSEAQRSVSTPADPNVLLTKDMCPSTPADIAAMEKIPYRALIGSLLYLVVCTRPDCAQAVGALCRYQQNPGQLHWTAAKRVLHYVLATSLLGLTFGGHANNNSFELVGFCDADWAAP